VLVELRLFENVTAVFYGRRTEEKDENGGSGGGKSVERKERKRGNGQRFVHLSVRSASSSLLIDALPSFLDNVTRPSLSPSAAQTLACPSPAPALGSLGVEISVPHEKETILFWLLLCEVMRKGEVGRGRKEEVGGTAVDCDGAVREEAEDQVSQLQGLFTRRRSAHVVLLSENRKGQDQRGRGSSSLQLCPLTRPRAARLIRTLRGEAESE
jgi:hypothetical protein